MNQLMLPGMPAPILHTPHESAHRPNLSIAKMGTLQKSVHRHEGRIIWASAMGDMDLSEKEWEKVSPEQPWHHNYLSDGGESSMLDVWLRAAANPAKYLTLLTADPGETGTPITMSEITGTGYARILYNNNSTDWPTLALNGGDFQATAVAKTFSAGGPWTGAAFLALVSSASGTTGNLFLVNPLSATRTLVNTDTLAVTLAIKQT